MAIIKDIKKHEEFIKKELKNKSDDKFKDLLAYHQNQIQNFQHERLVHLLVTLTFGLASLISFGLTLIFPQVGLMVLDVIFLVMLTFYLKHYFSLENSLQRLYRLDQEIAKKI